MGMVSKKFEFHNLNHEKELYLFELRNGMTEILIKSHRRFYVVRVDKCVCSAHLDICPCVSAKPTKNTRGLFYSVYGEESAHLIGVNNDMKIDRDFVDHYKEIEKAQNTINHWVDQCKLYKRKIWNLN